jgi:hypothetical protein
MRVVNRMLAVLLSIAIVAAVALVSTEAVRSALGIPPLLVSAQSVQQGAAAVSAVAWQDLSVRLVLVALLAVGIVLLVCQLWPRRRRFLRLASSDVDAVVPRTSLRRTVVATAADDGEVLAATAKLRRRRVRVAVSTTATDRAAVSARVAERVESRIAALAPKKGLKVAVRARTVRGVL